MQGSHAGYGHVPEGQPDAFNPAERLLASVVPCMIKNIERVAPC